MLETFSAIASRAADYMVAQWCGCPTFARRLRHGRCLLASPALALGHGMPIKPDSRSVHLHFILQTKLNKVTNYVDIWLVFWVASCQSTHR